MIELPFLKKKEVKYPLGRGFIPIDRVREMSSKGFSEPEIVDTLRKEGFSPDEIDKALTHVLKSAVEEKIEKAKSELPTLDEISPPKPIEEVVVPETTLPPEYAAPAYTAEEYIDYVINERMKEINEKIESVVSRFNEVEKRVEKMSEQFNEIIKMRSEEQKQILTKIDLLNETINEANIKTATLEKAFKETLPALIESVRALSDLVQRLKA